MQPTAPAPAGDAPRAAPTFVTLDPPHRPLRGVPGCAADVGPMVAEVARHLGPVDRVFHEVHSRTVHVDVLHVPPGPGRPCHSLVTSGMRDRPMNVPGGGPAYRHAELCAFLPGWWKLDPDALGDPRWSWPVLDLRGLARMPHERDTFLGWGHTVSTVVPLSRYPGTGFSAVLLVSPTHAMGLHHLELDGRVAHVYAVMPLYPEELRFKLRHGAEALTARLSARAIPPWILPGRANVCARPRPTVPLPRARDQGGRRG